MGRMRGSMRGSTRHTPRRAHPAMMARGVVGLMALALALTLGLAAAPATRAASGNMNIVVPAPDSGGTSSGTVGANVSIAGTGVAGTAFELGWATQDPGCATGFNTFDMAPVTADAGGNFTATIVWPDAASDVAATYVICARNQAAPDTDIIPSNQTYQVVSSGSPGISLSTSEGTAPDTLTGGTQLTISGSNYFPSGTQVYIFITKRADFRAQDYQPNKAIPTVDGSTITSGDAGGFTATIQVPADLKGTYYLHAVSANGVDTFPPSLDGSARTQIAPAPKPTATVALTPTSTVTTGGTGGSGGNNRFGLIVTLGAVSAVLFILGVILIASAVARPARPRSPALENPGSGGQW